MFLGSVIAALAYFQSFNFSISEALVIGAGGIVANALVQWKVTSAATARELGVFSAKIGQHDIEIRDLKQSNVKITDKLGKHTEDIARLETACNMTHKKAHHA